MLKYGLYILASVFAATGVYLFKGIKLPSVITALKMSDFITILSSHSFWIGLVFYGVAFLIFLYIINAYDVSSSLPALLGTYIIIIALMSFFFLDEYIGPQKILAYIMIIIGIALL